MARLAERPRPGEPDRRCDTIAELTDATGSSGPRAVVVELFTNPDPDACPRTLRYIGDFAIALRHGPHDRDLHRFSAAMIFLTTRPGVVEMLSDLPDDDATLTFRPVTRVLSEEVAVATLDAFGENRVGWGLLGWVPLMRGGQTAEVVARWRGGVENLADLGMRRTLVDVALVFARLTDPDEVWQKGLEGMEMNESPIMREQRDLGELKAWRTALLNALGARFTVPADMRDHIQQQTDKNELAKWLPLAVTADDLDAFRAGSGL